MDTKNNLNYYIREIILIFIAVMLALVTNHFYMEGKDAKSRKAFKLSILSDLCVSLEDLNRDLSGHKKAQIESIKAFKLFEIKNNNCIYSDSIKWDYIFNDFQFYPNTGTYISLKSRGFDLFDSEDQDLHQIVDLFELDFSRLVEFGKDKSQTRSIKKLFDQLPNHLFRIIKRSKPIVQSSLESNYFSNLEPSISGNEIDQKFYQIKPISIIDLLKSEEFKFLLFKAIEIRSKKILYYQEIHNKVCVLINKLSSGYIEQLIKNKVPCDCE